MILSIQKPRKYQMLVNAQNFKPCISNVVLDCPSILFGSCYLVVVFFVPQYPAWLEEKRSSLPAEELDRYKRQFSLVSDVCSEYEKESANDSEDVKKKRFEKLLGLMQQVSENILVSKMFIIWDEGGSLGWEGVVTPKPTIHEPKLPLPPPLPLNIILQKGRNYHAKLTQEI